MKQFPLVSVTVSVLMMLAPIPAFSQERYREPDTRIAYEDWVVECFAPNDIGQECQLYQRILMDGGSSIALVATLARVPPEQALHMQVALPLGIDIESGATLAIDDDTSLQVPISRCTQQGCIFEGVVSAGLERALADGGAASVTVSAPDRGPFTIPLSLNGFVEALDAITEDETLPATVPAEESDTQSASGDTAVTLPVEGTETPGAEDGEGDQVDDALRPVTGD
jgi:invasion protein IalB